MKPLGDLQNDSTGPDADDPRVVAAMEEYLAELEAGRSPDRQRFLARRPEIAAALAECLDGLAFIHAATPTLQSPNLAEAVTAAIGLGEVEPQPLGDFRIVREIGRGGMGVVYEAVQLSLGRRVALKVLPMAATLDPKQLQRFKNEAQAAAQLHHTNIVPVYAVGSERSVHYYAMQLIEGQSLATVIEDMRARGEERGAKNGEPGPKRQQAVTTVLDSRPADFRSSALGKGPRSGEFFRTAAGLGLKTAEALEHAHELGVIHRDVKPANLLIERADLWVTDFGLALFQSDAGLTMTGEVLGTLRYMSAEQALGKRGVVDHRTDVYSLGVTLYELLTLQPAFNGQDRQELLAQITCDEPVPPRRLNPAIPVELETIVLKAMARGPSDRYATAQEMADDLQRFLEHRPILARRALSLRDRATKWARRHRAVVGSALALLVMAVAGLVVATFLIAREHAATRAAYEREHNAAEEARAERTRAEDNFRQARKAVDFLTQMGEQELANLPPTHQGVRRRMLEVALSYYQDFLEQEQDPSIQAELEESWARVTRLLDELIALQGSGQLGLLKERAVQEDLKLTAGQKTWVVALADRQAKAWRTAFGSFYKQEPEQRRAKLLELARTEESALTELLDPAQEKRFRQLVVQVQQRGRHGFSDPEVVTALNLTVKQREKIRGILQKAYPAPWEMHFPPGKSSHASKAGPLPKGPLTSKGRQPYPPWKGATEKVLKVLTAAQQGKWRELTGAPLAEEVQFAPPGGLFPGRGTLGGPSGEHEHGRAPGRGRLMGHDSK